MDKIAAEKDNIMDILESNSLTVHFQPIHSLEGKILGHEALARFKGDSRFLNIAALFDAAIRTDTISSLDILCRENALRAASSLMKDKDTCLFMNICPETLLSATRQPGMTDELADRCGISREKIILEITEETAIRNYPLFKNAVSYYRDKGYKIALDDFGTGYGGLKMLSVIRPDFVKIDRHFISHIDRDFVNLALVESVTLLCHRLGMKVVAEGIERAEELTFAKSMGIDFFQGFLMGRPTPADARPSRAFRT